MGLKKARVYSVMPNLNATVTPAYNFAADPGYYVKVSAYFLKNPHYSPTAKVLYQLLCDLSNRYKDVWPGQDKLCYWLGRSEKPFRAARRELEAAGLITVKRRGQGNTDHYTVHPIPLINNYDSQNVDKVREARNNSRSGTGEGAAYEESEFKKHASWPFSSRNNKNRGPINFTKYTGKGKYGFLAAPTSPVGG